MSSGRANTDGEKDHSLATDAGDETAHLQDVVPEHAEEIDTEAEPPEQQLAKAQETIKDYWEQMMRLRAEIENNRKRAERDIEAAHKFALKNFVESLLPVIDSMEMGQIASTAENATLESINEGAALTMDMFIQALEKHGLEQIDPKGEKFDPERHQAISMIEDKTASSNSVVEVMQKGFVLNERLVRPAMVVVAK
jgi:molecular chaperone GrpE